MATTEPHRPAGTGERILDIGERLAQTRGYNGFSYADIAGELSITTASLHYHFPSKRRLGATILERHAQRFAAALDQITASGSDARPSLEAYVTLYRGVLEQGRMCLSGVLAAEQETLPPELRSALVRFFAENEAWLCALLERGRADGTLARGRGTPSDEAQMILGTLEGAMLVAHGTGDPGRFDAAARGLLDTLAA